MISYERGIRESASDSRRNGGAARHRLPLSIPTLCIDPLRRWQKDQPCGEPDELEEADPLEDVDTQVKRPKSATAIVRAATLRQGREDVERSKDLTKVLV